MQIKFQNHLPGFHLNTPVVDPSLPDLVVILISVITGGHLVNHADRGAIWWLKWHYSAAIEQGYWSSGCWRQCATSWRGGRQPTGRSPHRCLLTQSWYDTCERWQTRAADSLPPWRRSAQTSARAESLSTSGLARSRRRPSSWGLPVVCYARSASTV